MGERGRDGVPDASHIDVVEVERSGTPQLDHGRRVKDRIAPLRRGAKDRGVAHVAIHDRRRLGQALSPPTANQQDHFVPSGEKGRNNIATQEPGPPRDQNLHE